MQVIDTNKWLNPPENYKLHSISVEGAFLIVEYQQDFYFTGHAAPAGLNTVRVYLNDMGREVLRTKDELVWEKPKPEPPQPTPELSWWVRFNLWVFDLCSLSMFSRRIK